MLRNQTWLILCLLSLLLPVRAGKVEPFAGPRPMAVLVQENPWASVVGAETPRIVVYENGDVIYTRDMPEEKKEFHFLARLDMNAMSAVKDHLRTVTNLSNLQRTYQLSESTGLGSSLFYLNVDNREVVVSVYGLHPGGDATYVQTGRIPDPLRQLYNYLWTLQFAEARPWHSSYIETMIWPNDTSTEPAIVWPKDWPGLASDRALPRGDGYSIFLDGNRLGALKKFLATQKSKSAVEIDGRKWSLTWTPVFPSEPVWRKAFYQDPPIPPVPADIVVPKT